MLWRGVLIACAVLCCGVVYLLRVPCCGVLIAYAVVHLVGLWVSRCLDRVAACSHFNSLLNSTLYVHSLRVFGTVFGGENCRDIDILFLVQGVHNMCQRVEENPY